MPNRFCTKCGSAAGEGQRFCKVCGQPIAPAAAAPEEPAPPIFRPAADPWAGIESPGLDTGASLIVKLCTKCQTVLSPTQKSCWVCGQPVEETLSPSATSAALRPSSASPLPSIPQAQSAASSSPEWPETTAVVAGIAPPPPPLNCAKCQAPLTAGQSSCWVCGQPVAVTAVPEPWPSPQIQSQPEPAFSTAAAAQAWPETAPNVAGVSLPDSSLSCSKCHQPLTPGQKFCKQCGQPVPSVIEPAQEWPPASTAPAFIPMPQGIGQFTDVGQTPPPATPVSAAPAAGDVTKCPTCRTVLAPDQRICWVCGHVLGAVKQPETLAEMGAPTHTYNEVAIPEVTKARPTTPASLPPVVPQPILSPQAQFSPPPVMPPPGGQFTPTAPIPAAVAPLKKQSNAGLWIILGVLFVILAGGGAWLYFSRAKLLGTPVTTVTSQTTANSNPPSAVPSDNQPTATPPLDSTTPSSGAPLPQPSFSRSSAPDALTTASTAQPSHPSRPSSLASSATPKFSQPQQQILTVPPLDPMPAKPASGVLHYSGPPVGQNGVVVFDHLPAGRLRFTFDRDIWVPIITHNPDGTQKLTLRSSSPGMQSGCEVRWELVQ